MSKTTTNPTIENNAAAELADTGWTVEFMTPFTTLVGPLWGRMEENGDVCGFVVEPRHLNQNAVLARGALLTFADHAIGIPGAHMFPDQSMVTLELNTIFLTDAVEGEFIEGRSDVIHADESFIFVRGGIQAGSRLVASCEGVWKKVRPRA
jgi:acyl-coenzyme A thioesterase PaaI-like protein